MTHELMTPEETHRLAEQFAQAAAPLADAIAAAATAISSVFRACLDAVRDSLTPFAARLSAALRLIPRKWLRIYRNTKKRRIRKKYEKRIWAALVAVL